MMSVTQKEIGARSREKEKTRKRGRKVKKTQLISPADRTKKSGNQK